MRRPFPIALWVLASIAVTCAGALPPGGAPTVEDGRIVDLEDLRRALEERGFITELGDEVEQPFFTVTGRFLHLEGQDVQADVQAFEYPDEKARRDDSEQISPDGRTIGGTKPMWIGTPRFWARGRLVVLYLGDDEETIGVLTDALGEPIAEPRDAS